MFKRCVEVRFFLQLHDRIKMLVVDVGVYPEQTLQDGLCHCYKVSFKRDTYLRGEQCLIIKLVLYPGHEIVYIFRCRTFDWLLYVSSVSPVILILGASRHDWAALLCAEICDGPIKHVNLVEEIHSVDCDPLVQIFTLWQHDCHAQVSTPQCCLCMFQQLVLMGTLRDILLWFESLG